MTKQYFFRLDIGYTECVSLYQNGIYNVVIPVENGERVKLPSRHLRPFLGTNGIRGRFRLIVDNNNKMLSFEKVA